MPTATDKVKGTFITLAIVAAVIAGFSFFDTHKKEEVPVITIHAAQTLDGRFPRDVIVVVIVNDKPFGTFYPDLQTWDRPVNVPRGASVGLGVWQTSPGTVSCAIRRNGVVVSNDLTSKVTPKSASLSSQEAIARGAKCYYLNL